MAVCLIGGSFLCLHDDKIFTKCFSAFNIKIKCKCENDVFRLKEYKVVLSGLLSRKCLFLGINSKNRMWYNVITN